MSKLNRIFPGGGPRLAFHPANPVTLSFLVFFAAARLCGTARAALPEPDIARFISAKSNQVYLASRDSSTPAPPEVWRVFAAASAADWKSISNLLQAVQTNYHESATHRLAPEVWYRVQEVGGFGELMPVPME